MVRASRLEPVASLRVRIDDAEATREFWATSTSDLAAFSPNAIELIKSIQTAKTLRIEFTPLKSQPQVMTFRGAGLGDRAEKLAAACKWPSPGTAVAEPFTPPPHPKQVKTHYYVNSGEVPKPKKLIDVAPEYPELARRAKDRGPIDVRVTVDPEGGVSDAKAMTLSPWGLDEEAERAVRRWKYERTTVAGAGVYVVFTETVLFIVPLP